MRRLLLAMPLVALLGGCDLAPHYARPGTSVPSQWPAGAAYAPAINQPAGLPWQTLIVDPRLRLLIETALRGMASRKLGLLKCSFFVLVDRGMSQVRHADIDGMGGARAEGASSGPEYFLTAVGE